MASVIDGLAKKVGKFSFKTPEEYAKANNIDVVKVEKTFEYPECSTEDEAREVLAEKKWNLKDMVNEALKANARSNAYQTALLPYKPSEVSPDDIKERMVRDYIRMGIPEEVARVQIDALLKNASSSV